MTVHANFRAVFVVLTLALLATLPHSDVRAQSVCAPIQVAQGSTVNDVRVLGSDGTVRVTASTILCFGAPAYLTTVAFINANDPNKETFLRLLVTAFLAGRTVNIRAQYTTPTSFVCEVTSVQLIARAD